MIAHLLSKHRSMYAVATGACVAAILIVSPALHATAAAVAGVDAAGTAADQEAEHKVEPEPDHEVDPEADSEIGTLRVTGPSLQRQVRLKSEQRETVLRGELVTELARLQTATVEVLGQRGPHSFQVQDYRILAVSRGIKPMVGTLVTMSSGLGLSDVEGGEPIALSLRPKHLLRLEAQVGAKLWIYGEKLISGALKVVRFGILREPSDSTKQPSAGGDSPAPATEETTPE